MVNNQYREFVTLKIQLNLKNILLNLKGLRIKQAYFYNHQSHKSLAIQTHPSCLPNQ